MQIGTQAPRTAPEYWDVAVMGAGPAGIAAACTAARNGLRTLLVETGEKIGGVMSSCPGMMLGAGYPLGRSIGGFFEEFTQRLYQADPPRAERRVCAIPEFGPEVIYDPDYALFQLYAMLEEAGAQLRLSTRMESVTMKGDRIASVRLFGPEGMREVQAGVWLDCTGNGDLAAAAGVPFQLGDKNGSMMGATLTFFMEQVDWEKAFAQPDLYHTALAEKGIREGRLHPDIREIYFLKGFYPGSVFFNTVTLSGVNGLEEQSVQKALQQARVRCFELAEFCKAEMPGFENAYLTRLGPTLGIRETRKLEGLHCLTIQEIGQATKFPDGIVACDNPIDDVFRGEAKNYSNDRALQEGSYYTIPFRCLVPRKLENLLFAGRCICADDKAFASVRGMPQCMAMGQSIALAAGMALAERVPVQNLDPCRVAAAMARQGGKGIGGAEL